MSLTGDAPVCTARKHDTASAYFNGCRCPQAREKARLYRKRRLHGCLPPSTVNAIGASRRLRALMALGWPQKVLAEWLGESAQNLNEIVMMKYPTITVARHKRIAELYDRRCGTAGPSARARSWAKARGWAPPLAWTNIDDPLEVPSMGSEDREFDRIAVERACRLGVERVPLSDLDRREVERRLLASSLPAGEVAALLSVNVRTVSRARVRNRPSTEAA